MKKNIIAISVGVTTWYILVLFSSQALFKIINEDLRTNIYFVLIHTSIVSFISASVAGWLGKLRGLILGLITQSMITFIQIVLFQLDSSISGLFSGFYIYILWILIAGIGGAIGEKFRVYKIKFLNRDIIAILCGLLIWVVIIISTSDLNEYIFKYFINYYPYISYWTILLLLSFIAAFIVGWIGKSRGWILGLILQAIIFCFFAIFIIFSASVHKVIKETSGNYLVSSSIYILKQLPFIIAATIGGYLGGKMRRKAHS